MTTIVIYPTDTEYTIQERIAAKLNTIPKYVSFDIDLQKVKAKPTADIDAINILKYIKDKRDKTFSFYKKTDIRDAISKKVGKNFSILNDVILPFIYFRVSDDESFAELEYIDYAKNIEEAFKEVGETAPPINITKVLEKKKAFIDSLDAQIEETKKNAAKFEEGYKRLEKVQGKPYTPFELERIEIELETDWRTPSIMSVFNGIVLTKDIPFACLGDYYKILKGVVPPLIKSKEPGKIILLIHDEESSPEEDEEERSLVYIFQREGVVIIQMDLEIRNKREKDRVVEKILKLFPHNSPTIEKETQTGVNGVFYFPKQVLEPVVFSHLLLNDVSFYKTLAINESEKSTKTKEGVYTYFNAGSEVVSSVITPKTVYSYDPSMRDKDRKLFPEGDFYVSVRISKASSVKVVKKYQDTLSKIFSLYDTESKPVIKMYKSLLDPLGVEFLKGAKVKVKASTKVFLRKLIPEIFTSRYSRSCRKQPILIDEKDKDKYANALLFPKSASEGPQRWYACDHEDDKFVGLRINDPKSEYKFVPCCYKLDQRLDRNSWYNIYAKWKPGQEIEEECLVDTESTQQNVTTTRKLARYGLFGQLSDFVDINTVFKGGEFLRRGMDRSRLSFIQCVFEAVGMDYGVNAGTCKERVNTIRAVLEDIISKVDILNLARQGLYNKTLQEILQMVSNKSTYFDPRYFIPLLEFYFQCNIYVFTPETLLIPEHVQNFLHLARNEGERTVIILEHSGTEGENISHPQCELIVKSKLMGNKNSYESTDEIAIIVSRIFDDMCASYSLGKRVTYYTPEFSGYAPIAKQTINDYGKASCIMLEFDKNVVVLYPKVSLPPMPVRSETITELTFADKALKFMSLPFIVERKKILDGDKIVAFEIKTELNNTYFIPVLADDNEIFDSIPVSREKFFFPYEDSFLSAFKRQKRISHYIAEYCKFLFSKFILDRKLTAGIYDITEDVYNIFVNDFFILDRSYVYYRIPSKFGVINEGFVQNSKLIVNSEELVRRLLYMLRAEKDNVTEYYKLQTIPEPFTDMLDFDTYPSQIILHGAKTLAKFISDSGNVHIASSRLIPKKKEPYFFRNVNVPGDGVYLAADVGTLIDALSYIHNWTTRGFAYYLPPVSDEEEENMNITVYNYISEYDIPIIHNANSKNKIIAYKHENKVRFVVLLQS